MSINLTQEQVVERLGNMSVMELITLTKELEQLWGVEAKPQLGQAIQVIQEETQKVQQTEFDVVFVSFAPDKKMPLIKLVRELLGTGLLEAKTLVESLPKTIKEGVSKEDADLLKSKLVEAGAVVELK